MKLGRYYGGCIPSPADARGTQEPVRLLGMLLATPASVNLSNLLPSVWDQENQGSCTGHGCGAAIWGQMNRVAGAAGLPAVERPSPGWLYDLGRTIDGTTAGDVGSTVSSVLHGAATIGVVPEHARPYSDSVLYPPHNEMPALERVAYDHRLVTGTARILDSGSTLVDAVRAALAADRLVVFGTDVDEAFESLAPSAVWPGCTGRSLGGHCMVLCGYRTINGRTQFRIRNSWGEDWADGGSCWCDQGALAGFWDVWLVDTAPSWSGTEA